MKFLQAKLIAIVATLFLTNLNLRANEPDSVYIFSYPNHNGRNGLEVAYSIDQRQWFQIGNEYKIVHSDYGAWGSQKKMYDPFLFLDKSNTWRCVWSLNNQDGVLAVTSSPNLINWIPQDYPALMETGNVLKPEISYQSSTNDYLITWLSLEQYDSNMKFFACTTANFKTFSATKEVNANVRLNNQQTIYINGAEKKGYVNKVAWATAQGLINAQKIVAYDNLIKNRTFHDTEKFFTEGKAAKASFSADLAQSKSISDILFGIFFEDINYAADGGLYAELVQNRGFEYNLHDKKERDKSWTAKKAWAFTGDDNNFVILEENPIHKNNPHYAAITIENIGESLSNEGFDGIAVKAGEKFDVSIWTRTSNSKKSKITVQLLNQNNEVIGETSIKAGTDWKKVNTTLTSTKECPKAKLALVPQTEGTYHFDMVSLFPQNTFKGTKNGMRNDLAQAIADMKPQFVRFPGGCVAHGDGIHNIYNWKNTIGPLEARKPQRNIWNYQQSYGLGYYEFFQFCEDLGAEPVPVVAAGVPCQNSSDCGAGQQGGIPMCDMDDYVQDVLDLIEYCNGDKNTTWGKKRAEAGHPLPFNLKYLGIGNEDLIGDVFKERFEMIYKAVKEKHPEITVIGTVGPFYEGPDYEEGWKFNTELEVPMVDEHYYEQPGWFINNQHFYDRYDREKPAVYLGEYASRGNRLYNALSEAIYLTSIERNGDIVKMASYAPLLAKHGHTQWRTDLIFFNNTDVFPTPNYYVQMLYGQNAGDEYIPGNLVVSDVNSEVSNHIGASVVRDSKTGDVILKLVNILPVATNTNIQLNGLEGYNTKATQTVVSGQPDDKTVTPVESTIEVGSELNLPAYSFTVIRIHKAK